MSEEGDPPNFSLSDKIQTINKKGTLLVLVTIATSENGLRHFEIEEATQLPQGTVNSSIQRLQDLGWVREEEQLDEAGLSAKFFRLSGFAEENVVALRTVGRMIFE